MSSQSPSETSVQASCTTCRRRKVRCDKGLPCAPCTRGGHACSYRPREPRARRARRTTINDVATRISELEKSLSAVSPGHMVEAPLWTTTPRAERTCQPSDAGPGRASPSGEILLKKGSLSQYFDEVLVSRVIEQEHDVRTALATPRSDETSQPHTPSPFNPMGILSSQHPLQTVTGFHPPKLTAMQLWKVFVDNVDSCVKIIHVPTVEVIIYTVMDNPDNASMEALALCFAIYYAATIALDLSEGCTTILREDWAASLQRFKTGLEQALAHADFLENPTVMLLQAMAIYLTALRVHNTGRAVWTLNGLAIRAAQSIGLHRDGKKLGLSPFESEIRRRLWWYFLGRDLRAAEDYGLHNTSVSCLTSEVGVPLNLEDGDLFPDMAELPPSRVGWTRMTIGLAGIQFHRAHVELQQLVWSSSEGPRYSVRDQIIQDLRSRVVDILKGCNPLIPSHRITLLSARFLLRKLDFVTRQQWQAFKHPNEQELLATEESLLEALNILEEEENIRTDDLLRPFRWSMRTYPQFHLTLFILWHVCVRPMGPSARRAFEAVEIYVDEIERTRKDLLQGSKWTILRALRAKAATMIPPRVGVGIGAGTSVSMDQASDGMTLGSVTTRGFVELSDAGMMDDMQFVPGWSTLLQDFLQDETNFSVLL